MVPGVPEFQDTRSVKERPVGTEKIATQRMPGVGHRPGGQIAALLELQFFQRAARPGVAGGHRH